MRATLDFKKIAAYVFVSIVFSNAVIIIISKYYHINKDYRDAILKHVLNYNYNLEIDPKEEVLVALM
jgi:hypothetical protein